MKNIKIEQLNYFGQSTNSRDFNAKVLYRKNGKLYLAHIWVCFFNRAIYIANQQPKECKVLAGLGTALDNYGKEHYFKTL